MMEEKPQPHMTYHRSKTVAVMFLFLFLFAVLMGRMVYLMVFRSEYYTMRAKELHERERSIKAARGRIIDANGRILADNRTVCTISVIHSQIEDAEEVIAVLCRELGLSDEYVRKRVEKYSSIEKIKSNVDKSVGDAIRACDLPGVKVDEDYRRYYPCGSLGSKVLGFTGGDNQGIIGLEVVYEDYLKGQNGTILTVTDAKGVEVDAEGEERVEPVAGRDLYISMDMNIQSYATQLALQTLETKEADSVSIIVMNPNNGELLAMVNVPEFDLNDPYTLPEPDRAAEAAETADGAETGQEQETEDASEQDRLNAMWRNGCINDTYEPGSTFKIVTAAAGLESGAVSVTDTFHCPGYIMVEDRRIRCHKIAGHGAEDFVQATMNSCNPVFITVGLRIGAERFYSYFERFGLLKKTGIDLPGEAGTIMHRLEDIGPVELATMSFGQSFQITPIQLMVTAASIVNGGVRVTPHFGIRAVGAGGADEEAFCYPVQENIVSAQTSETMRYILEKVVSEGGGKNGAIEGYRIGGKTATSQTLPRSSGRYIASFLAFAPADDPQIMAMAIINNPQGSYYGGQIAAPVVRQLFENILPYLENMDYNKK